MDLVGWSEEAFRAIEAEFSAFAKDLGISEIKCIPVAAATGDNVIGRSRPDGWYRGPALLDHLEAVPLEQATNRQPFRMPIQWINRPDPDFRGYSGLIASGEVSVGMPVQILPSGRASQVARIVTFDGDLDRALAGRSVTLTFDDPSMRPAAISLSVSNNRRNHRTDFRADLLDGQRQRWRPAESISSSSAPAPPRPPSNGALNAIDLDTQHPAAADHLPKTIPATAAQARPPDRSRPLCRQQTDRQLHPDRSGILRHCWDGLRPSAAADAAAWWWFSKAARALAALRLRHAATLTETRALLAREGGQLASDREHRHFHRDIRDYRQHHVRRVSRRDRDRDQDPDLLFP